MRLLFGSLKNTIYMNRLHTLEELQETITNKIRNITDDVLHHVFENVKRSVNLGLLNYYGHFEHMWLNKKL